MKIRSRIFIVFIVIISIGMFTFTRWLSADLKSRYNEAVEEPLVDVANLLAEIIGSQLLSEKINPQQLKGLFDRSYQRQFSAQIFELEKINVDMQLYITDSQGIVVFDSLDITKIGEDYSQWNDVARTLKGEYGARSSPIPNSLKKGDEVDVIAFVAAPILVDDEIVGVLSIGKPKYNVRRFLSQARNNQIIAAVIVGLSTLILGFVVYRWVSRPLDKLASFANQVSQGERVDAPDLGDNEIGDVGKAVQSMREALEGKEYSERYVQSLTHELKSPLSAIRGAAELLHEGVPADQHSRFIQNIQTETQRLEDIVERMLQLASLEKRVSLENVETINLRLLLPEIVEDFHVESVKNNLSIKLALDENLKIGGEQFLIRHAVANLLQNAIDFSPAESEIVISAQRKDGIIEIIVSDQGPGFPDYAKDRIFERFYSLPRPDTDQKSTGLGLNFVKEVAELHGGSIQVAREEERTRAIFKLAVLVQV
ncbi:MAG: two-component system sensor histidine kinase CreC [Gammaproteobacteria bacterium]|nr:two-component system sensor histidine kinase CreC [Gammaproteobacteria bacterium]